MMEEKQISNDKASSVASLFGTLPNGAAVFEYTLTNGKDLSASFINYGATITKLLVKRGNGKITDVILGFESLADYIAAFALPSAPYFGSVIGRYAGRIAYGKFAVGDVTYQLEKNNGEHTLHGGLSGFGRAFWKAEKVIQDKDKASITFTYTSQDGEENFPGALTVSITYTLTSDNEVVIEYTATTTADTVLNLTQHSYFNLDGQKENVLNQELTVHSPVLLDINPEGIPTGDYIDAADKQLDFTQPTPCPPIIDNSFVFLRSSSPAASLKSHRTGIGMTVYTDQPSVHIYIGGNCFDQITGKEGASYHRHSGICFEAQNFPDAPNHANFPSSILRKDETYRQRTLWKFELL